MSSNASRTRSPIRRTVNRTKSNELGRVTNRRPGLTRTKSFESSVRGMLPRSLSFSKRNVKQSHIMIDERNIFGSDIVSRDFVFGKLMEVKREAKVVKLEVEDLLVSQHHSMLPIVKGLVVTGKREWQWVRYADTVDAEEFEMWHQNKKDAMQDYEKNVEDAALYKNIVSFDATLRIGQGTSTETLQNILKTLKEDATVRKMQFAGALHSSDQSMVPVILKKVISEKQLTEDITITVTCDWSTSSTVFWKLTLTSCLHELQRAEQIEISQQAAKVPLRRVKTDQGQPSQTTIKRKKNMRKIKSAETDREPPQRALSMPMRGRRRALNLEARAIIEEIAVLKKTPKDMEESCDSTTVSTSSCSRSSSPASRGTPDFDWKAGVYLKSSNSKAA